MEVYVDEGSHYAIHSSEGGRTRLTAPAEQSGEASCGRKIVIIFCGFVGIKEELWANLPNAY
ncbi:hypothetical protein AAII07_19745 [Microvirga sp. 0TCS3.31]